MSEDPKFIDYSKGYRRGWHEAHTANIFKGALLGAVGVLFWVLIIWGVVVLTSKGCT